MQDKPPTEPDPFKNARGLSAMFGNSRSSGPPMIVWVGVAALIMGVLGFRMYVASERQADYESSIIVQRELDRMQPGGRGLGSPGMDLGVKTDAASVDRAVRKVCTKITTCSGGEATDPRIEQCVGQQTRVASDELTKSVLVSMYDGLWKKCGALECDAFVNCYFDTLKGESEAVAGPTKPLAPAERERIMGLICDVILESGGNVPDLNAPGASPKARALKSAIDAAGAGALAEIMKEAMTECPARMAPAASAH